jgi:predicted DNA-binding transcriptional regulator YafY
VSELDNRSVWIDYTNHRGERRWRKIQPHRLMFAATKHHPWAQWLLVATDLEHNHERWFAMKDIHQWREEKPNDL